MLNKIDKNLTKKEISNNIKDNLGLPHSYSVDFLDSFIEILIYTLKIDKKFNVKNFGSFKLNFKKSRKGRNPKTKEEFEINERNVVKFTASNYLKKLINE
jgi:integration host factor subunit alpha